MRFHSIAKDNGTLITFLSVGLVGGISAAIHKKSRGLRRDMGAADISATAVEALEDVGMGAMNRQLLLFPPRR